MEERLEKYTAPRIITALKARIRPTGPTCCPGAAFQLERAQRSWRGWSRLHDQSASRRIVVYANEVNPYGATYKLRSRKRHRPPGPADFNLPDPNHMRVRAKVNESKVSFLYKGQPASIRVDAFPDRPMRGTVGEIAAIPAPSNGPVGDGSVQGRGNGRDLAHRAPASDDQGMHRHGPGPAVPCTGMRFRLIDLRLHSHVVGVGQVENGLALAQGRAFLDLSLNVAAEGIRDVDVDHETISRGLTVQYSMIVSSFFLPSLELEGGLLGQQVGLVGLDRALSAVMIRGAVYFSSRPACRAPRVRRSWLAPRPGCRQQSGPWRDSPSSMFPATRLDSWPPVLPRFRKW